MYFGAASRGEDVIIKSRQGSYRIVPVKEDDIIVSRDGLTESLYKSFLQLKEAQQGKRKLLSREDLRREMGL